MANFFRPKSYAMKVDPTLNYAWINIPKCASSFVQKVLDDNGWQDVPNDLIDRFIESASISKIAILRDPVKRWISGFSQCMSDQNMDAVKLLHDKDFWNTLVMNPVYDDHTEYQHRFIGNAVNLQYIYLDKASPNDFYRHLTSFVRSTGGNADFDTWTSLTNPAENDPHKHAIYQELTKLLSNDDIIEKAHKTDYELLGKYDRFTN